MKPSVPENNRSNSSATFPGDETSRSRLFTIPNVLTAIRLVGAPLLLVLALTGQTRLFLGLFLFLALTDWLDGKLAILLKQRTVLGARLDSWADAACYGGLLIGALWLRGSVLWSEAGWIVAALGSYVLTTTAGFVKFGRWPSYHTRAAKTSWLLVVIGVICLLGDISLWPFRVAMFGVTLTNLEATMITWTLPAWHINVPSLYHARKLARQHEASSDSGTRDHTPTPRL